MMNDSTDLWIGIQALLGEVQEVQIIDRTTIALTGRGGVHQQVEASVSLRLKPDVEVQPDQVLEILDKWRIVQIRISVESAGTIHELELVRVE